MKHFVGIKLYRLIWHCCHEILTHRIVFTITFFKVKMFQLILLLLEVWIHTHITSLSNWLDYFGTIFEGVKKDLDSKCQEYNTHISLSEILKLTDGNYVFLIVVFISIRWEVSWDVTVAVSAIFQIGDWGLFLCSLTLKIKLPEQCIPNVAHRSRTDM